MVAVAVFPPVEGDRRSASAPITRVTLLEDRAQVRREVELELVAGVNRFVIADVAPVLQDVSLAASLASSLAGGAAKIADVRVRRAMRVLDAEKPEKIAELDREILAKIERMVELDEERARGGERLAAVQAMLARGIREVPEDAAWGLVNHQVWRDTFETLFKRARELQTTDLARRFTQLDLREDAERLTAERIAAERPDVRFAAWIELDVLADASGRARVVLEYVVPNALWRPMHSARLEQGGRLTITSSAVVWQNTGEDWSDVELLFSTARSSLGTEPPLLTDDHLSAQKKAEQVSIAVRDVAIQRASVKGGPGGGGASASRGLELPGVDDGGDIQTLRAKAKSRVPSDGRPNVIAVGELVAEAERALVVIPELDEKAFLEVRAVNTGAAPLLAGPVELIRDHGFVGWTKLLFVAPKERFQLSFGPDDAIRVLRRSKQDEEKNDLDGWRVLTTKVLVYLSNLSGEAKTLRVSERIPVSEIREVKVALRADDTSTGANVDDDGIVTWTVALGPHDHQKLRLAFSLSVAPGVEGL